MYDTNIIDIATDITQHLANHKRYIKASQELSKLRGNRGRPSLAMELLLSDLREPEATLDKAIDRADTEAHSSYMMIKEALQR